MAPVCPSSILFRRSSNPLHPLVSPYILLGAKDCWVLFGWLLGLCWQGLQGSGYHRHKVWAWHRCPNNRPLCELQSCSAAFRWNRDARLSDLWRSGEHLLKVLFKNLKNQSTKQRVTSNSGLFCMRSRRSPPRRSPRRDGRLVLLRRHASPA